MQRGLSLSATGNAASVACPAAFALGISNHALYVFVNQVAAQSVKTDCGTTMIDNTESTAETSTARRSIIALRIGFIASLSAIAIICAFFFAEQSARNQSIQQVSALSRQLATLDHIMRDLAFHSGRLAETHNEFSNYVDPRLANATLAQKREIIASLAIDPDIISSIASLDSRLIKARRELFKLRFDWDKAPAELTSEIQSKSRYMTTTDPFQNHEKMLASERIDAARTKKDIYWIGRETHSLYEGVVEPSNLGVQERLRDYLAGQSLAQGALLQRYLLATIGILVVLGFGVFVPIDMMIRRMVSRLQDKTRETNDALVKAKAADRAKSEFLATMSHEIRTPMNGVLGMAELLTRTELDTRQRTFTDIILKSGNALLEIINDILDFSKIDAGQMVLCPKPFNLVDTTEDVATLMSSRVVEKDIELVVRIAPGLPDRLIGDPGRIRQVLTNLVGNAVKFTEQGHVMVEITWQDAVPQWEADEGVAPARRLAISFAVRDTGIGIPEDKIEAVFDKFSQVDGSSTRKHEGTGLGLAIATRLVDLMGGRIKAESTLGEGSTFSFEIEMDVDESANQSAESPAAALPGRRVLVIDDNAINRMILTEQMRDWGFDCVAVESGEIGLDLLRHARSSLGIGIDLLVLDFQMPGMTGAEVARAIRSDPLIADTPILVLSSIDQADQLEALDNLDIYAQLTKPVRTAQLRQTVQSALQKALRRPAYTQPVMRTPLTPESAAPPPPVAVSDSTPAPSASEERPEDHARVQPAVQTHELADTQAPIATQAPISAQEQVSTGSEREPLVMVAEDNQVNQIVFQQSLDSLGINHDLAINGRDAVEMWARLRPDLVLMDVSMPELNGMEATAEIRAIEAREGIPPTPIIAVTAHSLKGDEDRCLAAGMDDYLSKPISPEKLAAMIERWLPGVQMDTDAA